MENDPFLNVFLPEKRSDIKAIAAINRVIGIVAVVLIVVAIQYFR